MTLKSKMKDNRGFSLMEFLVVIGILAVIAVISVPIIVGVMNSSNKKNDEVLASTYSEYMQKFATEKAGSSDFYASLGDNGAEYDILQTSSGQGSYPGLTKLSEEINKADKEDDVWDSIRKEACIAIKAYSGKDLADNINYFVEKPNDEKMAFVYYYLTGTVALKPISEMENSKVTSQDVNDGAVDTEDYWVYLDRTGGSGKAIGSSALDERDFYVKVVQFGTNLPVNGALVTIKPHGSSVGTERKATTSATGLIVFRDVYKEIEASASRHGAIDFWDATFYADQSPFVNLYTNPTIGTFENPYVITLKMGTLGSLEYFEQYKVYDYNSVNPSSSKFVTQNRKLMWYNKFTTGFSAISSTGKNEEFHTSVPDYNPLALLGYDEDSIFRFLIFGDYDLHIVNHTKNPVTNNSYFLDYFEKVTSDVYGLYNTANPGAYKDSTVPYAYPVVLKRTDTLVKGSITAEKKEQPLDGTIADRLLSSSDSVTASKNGSVTVTTYIYLVNKNNRNEYFRSEPLTRTRTDASGNYVYDFEIYMNNVNDGTKNFEVFLVTLYGKNDTTSVTGKIIERMNISAWPSEICGDGSIYVLNTVDADFSVVDNVKVDLQKDVETTTVKFNIYEKHEHINKGLDYTLYLYRDGYNKSTGTNVYYTQKSSTSDPGKVTISNVKKGFYTAHIVYADPDRPPEDIPVIIDDEPDIIIPKDPLLVTYEIYAKAVTKSNGAISGKGILSSNPGFWGAVEFVVKVDGVELQLGSSATDYEGGRFYVDYNAGDNNLVCIKFVYSITTSKLEVLQKSRTNDECFDQSDGYTYNGYIGKGQPDRWTYTNKTSPFSIHRLENEPNSNKEHVNLFSPSHNDTYHWEVCGRCFYERAKTTHYNSKNLSTGAITSGKVSYTAKYSYTSNNTSVSTTHKKNCTVCGYSKDENCSGGTWTPVYNGKTGSLKSSSRHYKYCTSCSGRWSYGSHTSGGYADKDDAEHSLTCTVCSYEYDTEAHTFDDGEELTKPTCTVQGEFRKTCIKCGHTRSTYTSGAHKRDAQCENIHTNDHVTARSFNPHKCTTGGYEGFSCVRHVACQFCGDQTEGGWWCLLHGSGTQDKSKTGCGHTEKCNRPEHGKEETHEGCHLNGACNGLDLSLGGQKSWPCTHDTPKWNGVAHP